MFPQDFTAVLPQGIHSVPPPLFEPNPGCVRSKPMSLEAVVWAKQQSCGCPHAKAVLLELANSACGDGICEFRMVADTARVVEISERTVQRALKRLEVSKVDGGLSLIQRVVRFGRGGGQQANHYELLGYIDPTDRESTAVCQAWRAP